MPCHCSRLLQNCSQSGTWSSPCPHPRRSPFKLWTISYQFCCKEGLQLWLLLEKETTNHVCNNDRLEGGLKCWQHNILKFIFMFPKFECFMDFLNIPIWKFLKFVRKNLYFISPFPFWSVHHNLQFCKVAIILIASFVRKITTRHSFLLQTKFRTQTHRYLLLQQEVWWFWTARKN